ncbi:type IV secretion system protein [Desulfofalx alkaliphila]|uniref:type IV secretion system protein n=1 Tax=Desulfofalx alkaliphila TaxID=105483 RepID=UPI0004E0F9D5|nr:hypothetical protein [Desulfofalx alkaliphila]
MAHPNLWGTTDTRNGLPTTTRESPDFSHGECQPLETAEIQWRISSRDAWGVVGTVPMSDGRFNDSLIAPQYADSITYRIRGAGDDHRGVTVGGYTPPESGGGNDGGFFDNIGNGGMFDDIFTGDQSVLEAENNASFIERFLAEIVMIIPRFVDKVIGIDDPFEIVFNRDMDNNMAPRDDLHLYTFEEGEWLAIGYIYTTFKNIIPYPLMIALAAVGLFMLAGLSDSQRRLSAKDYLSGFVVAVMLISFGEYLWQFLFAVNHFVVEVFYSTIEHRVSDSGFIATLCRWDTASFGMAIISFVTVLIIAIMTWQYALRKIMLAILMLIMPVVAVAGVFPQTRGVFGLWLREFMANLFLQAGHAAALALFVLFTASGTSFWLLMAFLLGLNSIANLVRRVIGAETMGGGALGATGTMLGLGSVLALSKMGKGFMGGGGKVTSPGAEMATAGVSAGVATGTTSTAMGAAASLGKGVAAVTAGLAGGAMAGMASGSPGIGIIAGGAAGSAMGSKVGQLSDFISDTKQDAKATGQGFMETAQQNLGIYDKGQLYDGESASNIGKNMLGGTGVLGGIGAIAGKAASLTANTAHAFGFGSDDSKEMGQQLNSFQQNARTNMAKAEHTISKLTPMRERAQLGLQLAKAQPESPERTLAVQDAQTNLDKINGQIADAQLTVMDAQYALSNEGTQWKIEQVREAQAKRIQANGGLNGHQWNSSLGE